MYKEIPGTLSREDEYALEEGDLRQGSENRHFGKEAGKVTWVGRPE